jgi:hypothetical protein
MFLCRRDFRALGDARMIRRAGGSCNNRRTARPSRRMRAHPETEPRQRLRAGRPESLESCFLRGERRAAAPALRSCRAEVADMSLENRMGSGEGRLAAGAALLEAGEAREGARPRTAKPRIDGRLQARGRMVITPRGFPLYL